MACQEICIDYDKPAIAETNIIKKYLLCLELHGGGVMVDNAWKGWKVIFSWIFNKNSFMSDAVKKPFFFWRSVVIHTGLNHCIW